MLARLNLLAGSGRKFLSVHNHPAVIGSGMRRAMNVVYTRGEFLCVEIGLAESKHLRLGAGGDLAIESVVGDHLNEFRTSGGHGRHERKNLMIAMRATRLRGGRAGGNSADHHVIHRLAGMFADEIRQRAVYLRGAGRGYGNVGRTGKAEAAKKCQCEWSAHGSPIIP
jgi:hypothetical protein